MASTDTNELPEDKLEIQRQWDNNPCGAETAAGVAPETIDFYRAVRTHRYSDYAPWMDRVLRFDEWHGRDVLEIGVGVGSDHYRFARNGNRMTALDLSRAHLRHTQRHLQLEGLSNRPIYGDAERMPFADASFDLVYAFGVIHHTPDTEAAVAEIHRVLRPGGTALIALYHRDSIFFWLGVLLRNGLLRGQALGGWRKLLATVEYRAEDEGAQPLVKVYSRGQTRRLFNRFERVEIETCHVGTRMARGAARLVKLLDADGIEKLLSRWGWYLIIRAHKAGGGAAQSKSQS